MCFHRDPGTHRLPYSPSFFSNLTLIFLPYLPQPTVSPLLVFNCPCPCPCPISCPCPFSPTTIPPSFSSLVAQTRSTQSSNGPSIRSVSPNPMLLTFCRSISVWG